MVLCVCLLCSVNAHANEALYSFGERACEQALNNQLDGIDGKQYRRNLLEDGLSVEAFCQCTAERFVNNAPYQQEQMMSANTETEEAKVMQSILKTNMAGCFASNGG